MATQTTRQRPAREAVKTRAARTAASKPKKRTTKGALIKGMTKQLPSEILASPIFRKKLQELMKGYAGIYALYHRDQPYYVGLTTNLFGRVNGHMKDRHKGQWDHFVIFRIGRSTI